MYNSRSRQFFSQNLYNIKFAITLFTCFCMSCANPEVPQNKLFRDYKDLGINPDSSSIFNLNRDSSIYELNFANINLKGMFEVDNDKVFSINKIRNLNVRSLIFDFNAQLGDTIQRTNEIFNSIIVDNVTFKKQNGETEKIQNFRLSFKHLNPNFYLVLIVTKNEGIIGIYYCYRHRINNWLEIDDIIKFKGDGNYYSIMRNSDNYH